jgi:hypothetical protein
LDFDYELPHKWPNNEYKEKYEELERQMIELIAWPTRWFGFYSAALNKKMHPYL